MHRNYSKSFERDWAFYLGNMSDFTFIGNSKMPKIVFDKNGENAKYCFWKWDSSGKMLPTEEIDLLRDIIVCKKAINWQIKEWADSLFVGITVNELLRSFKNPPFWVKSAIVNQRRKYYGEINKKRIYLPQ